MNLTLIVHLLVVIILLVATKSVVGQEPNVCSTFEDYYQKENNPNCWYNPDAESDAVSIFFYLKKFEFNL